MLITTKLFEQVLMSPATDGANRLRIVSGYASSGMADYHMAELKNRKKPISIELVVGMALPNVIQHRAFQNLSTHNPYDVDFLCSYVVDDRKVHAKSFCWLENDKPLCAYVGSANYSRNGFLESGNREILAKADPIAVSDFYDDVLKHSRNCVSWGNNISDFPAVNVDSASIVPSLETVDISLLEKKTGNTPPTSGINWGQRKGRNKNQAYIALPAEIYNSDFFPPRPVPFTVRTDDNEVFIMVRAQDRGKGIHTTQSNAILGEYLRKRIGVASEEYVTKDDLMKYGRDYVTFTKINEETYLMDYGRKR